MCFVETTVSGKKMIKENGRWCGDYVQCAMMGKVLTCMKSLMYSSRLRGGDQGNGSWMELSWPAKTGKAAHHRAVSTLAKM